MNQLGTEKRAQIVSALVEGNSIRAVTRMTGASKNTITKLLVELGSACANYLNKTLVNLSCQRVQCDEIWSFVAAKEANVTQQVLDRSPRAGDVWTWVALDADTKLVCSWAVGRRDWETAWTFVKDLEGRMANRIQLTTDGNKLYLFAINAAFQGDIDYAVLMKIYGSSSSKTAEIRYTPAECTGCEKKPKIGNPDYRHISTSFVERQNLTMRMQMRRFTRLTNAFSKKFENHMHMCALYTVWYNFVKLHKAHRMTPAMAAGVTDKLWSMTDLAEMVDATLPKGGPRGPYKRGASNESAF